MFADLSAIDPQRAWSPYQPDSPDAWTHSHVAHLFRRAGFGANWKQLEESTKQKPQGVVDSLFADTAESEAFRKESEDLGRSVLATGDSNNLGPWWFHRILNSPNQLREKMTLFWHGHFATSAAKVNDIQSMFAQNQMLRQHALGDFNQMVQQISRDPAMLIYLDSSTNRKAHANENYARELMELFCLGEGNYTEKDVQELARCFTGWEIRRNQFRFNRFQHDTGEKTILGKTQVFTGEEAVAQVLAQASAPRFIVQKLIRYLVFDEPAATPELVEPLAQQFRDEGLNLAGLLKRILGSNLFFSPQSIARKVRSPVELVAGLLRSLEGSTNLTELAPATAQLGQSLFYPPNVKGWDGGRAWINSATLLGRANVVRQLLTAKTTRFGGAKLQDLATRYSVTSPPDFVNWLRLLLLSTDLPSPAIQSLTAIAEQGSERRYEDTLYALAALPEFQLN
jgi:uncharacterized protein (DUF1800 family)